ncbi:MAG: hypothetical protein ACRDJN_21690 [Chloroflexota bacterium]
MAKELPTIAFDDFAKRLPLVFDDVARRHEAILVERHGVLYRLEPETPAVQTAARTNIWANYDPDKVRAALRESAGALAGIDRDELLRDLYEQRAQESEGRPAE